MADDFDKMFEEFERLADTSRNVLGQRTVTAYDEIKHPSLSDDEGDGLLPPEEPSEDELKSFIRELPTAHKEAFRTYVQEEPSATGFSRLLDEVDVAAPAKNRIIRDEIDVDALLAADRADCEVDAEADQLLTRALDRKYLAPAPKPGYYLHKAVDEISTLYTIYRTFRAMISYDVPIVTIQVGDQTLGFYSEGNVVHLSDADRTVVYQHEDTGKPTDVLIWVSNSDGRLGYIFNGWTYRRENS